MFLMKKFVRGQCDEHAYSTYDNALGGGEALSSKRASSNSASSDGGTCSSESSAHSWVSSQTNLYEQICYDSVLTDTDNDISLKYRHQPPPYTPNFSCDETTEHYYQQLPTPASLAISSVASDDSTRNTPLGQVPLSKSQILQQQQSNSKRELHKELAYRQKMGQLLPKKPELINVFLHRRDEEKKREDNRMRERTKLEEILARQRQKLDELDNVCSTSNTDLAYSNEFEFVYHRIRQQKKKTEATA